MTFSGITVSVISPRFKTVDQFKSALAASLPLFFGPRIIVSSGKISSKMTSPYLGAPVESPDQEQGCQKEVDSL